MFCRCRVPWWWKCVELLRERGRDGGAVIDVELGEDAGEIRFHGCLGHVEAVGDVPVGGAVRDEEYRADLSTWTATGKSSRCVSRRRHFLLHCNAYNAPRRRVNGFNLDDRLLLSSAFAEFTQEPAGRGVDQADATVPALTGAGDRDWTAFSAVYQQVTDHPVGRTAVPAGFYTTAT
jgi:hypothetical protein